MEAGKREEAGPSSVTGEEKKNEEVNLKVEDFEALGIGGDSDDGDDDDELLLIGGGEIGSFVPGPLLSLKDQIEKDKVLFPFPFSYFCLQFLCHFEVKGYVIIGLTIYD